MHKHVFHVSLTTCMVNPTARYAAHHSSPVSAHLACSLSRTHAQKSNHTSTQNNWYKTVRAEQFVFAPLRDETIRVNSPRCLFRGKRISFDIFHHGMGPGDPLKCWHRPGRPRDSSVLAEFFAGFPDWSTGSPSTQECIPNFKQLHMSAFLPVLYCCCRQAFLLRRNVGKYSCEI